MGFLSQNLSTYSIKSSAKRWCLLLFTTLISTVKLFGQTVTIIDAFTQQPLENVMIVNQDKQRYTTSNLEGNINLNYFAATDSLRFQ